MKEKFVDFLKKNRAFSTFQRTLLTERKMDFSTLDEYLSACPPDSYLDAAFVWLESKEGHRYWRQLNEKWLRELETVESKTN